MTYVEEPGLSHLVSWAEGRNIATLCERLVEDASTLERDVEPKPLCARCRERVSQHRRKAS